MLQLLEGMQDVFEGAKPEIMCFFMAVIGHYVFFLRKWRKSKALPTKGGKLGMKAKDGAISPTMSPKLLAQKQSCENARKIASLKAKSFEAPAEKAIELFRSCPQKSTGNCNALLELCLSAGDAPAAERLMVDIKEANLADIVTYNLLVKARLESGNFEKARQTLEEMRLVDITPNSVTMNELLEAALRREPKEAALTLMNEMVALGAKPSRITCSILFKGAPTASGAKYVNKVLSMMETTGEEFDEVLLGSLIEACIRMDLKDILANNLKKHTGLLSMRIHTAHAYGSIIRGFGFLQDIEGVWKSWRELRKRQIELTSVTVGCMAEALATNSDPDGGYVLIRELMDDAQTRPFVNGVIYGSVLKGFSREKRFPRVWTVYTEMVAEKMQLTAVTFNTLVDACARCGQMKKIQGILEEMSKQKICPNVITYSAIVKGYCQDNRIHEALELMEEMKRNRAILPDEHTYNTVINGCARQGLYEKGMALLTEMCEVGVPPSNFTLTVLVKLASRRGRMQKAFDLCEELSKKYNLRLNVHVYNGLVQACIGAKELKSALSVLELMVQERCRLDARTYLLLLRACVEKFEVLDAAGLLRSAHGLRGGHRLLEGASKSLFMPHGGLPADLVHEIIGGIRGRCNDPTLAALLDSELRQNKLG